MTNIYTALAKFQEEIKPIVQNTSGYNYKYADLGSIIETIKPILAKNGLGFVQPLDGKSVKTIIFHSESGDNIEGTVEIPQGVELKGMNAYQSLGSAITYLRRYSLASMLGLITEEDTDASGEQIIKQDSDVRI